MAERRNMKMHPKILWDVISKQAGTLSKAILEGAMNSIDAGATRCDITIDRGKFSISDDGKGFTSRRVIEKCFETFGTPHTAGDATYGRFRMGRGQIFSFGQNDWASNEFRMHVDLKAAISRWDEHEEKVAAAKAAAKAEWEKSDKKRDLDEIMDEIDTKMVDNFDFSLGYELEEGAASVKGCQIGVNLYKKLLPSELDSTVREIKEYLAWAQIPVYLNGQQINKLPQDAKWDIETDDAYISIRDKNTLDVYNLGVLVNKFSAHRFGTGGVVVSKKQLEVNFARNDIQSTCKVWGRVSRRLKNETSEKNVRKARLTDAERQSLVERLISGDLSLADAIKNKVKIITDVNGSHHSLDKIISGRYKWQHRLSVAEIGDQVASTAHDRNLAFVLAQSTLDHFGVNSIKAFVKELKKIADNNHGYDALVLKGACDDFEIVDRKKFDEVISDSHIELEAKELSKAEKVALDVIQCGGWQISTGLWKYWESRGVKGRYGSRKIKVGVSDTAEAWTDGTNNIWLNRNVLRWLKDGYPGMVRIAALLLHEYGHDDSDVASHVHDAEFYQLHHDLSIDTDILGAAADAMFKRMINIIRKEQKTPTGAFKSAENRIAESADVQLNMEEVEDERQMAMAGP